MISDKRFPGGFRKHTGKEGIKVFALLASLALLLIGNSTFGQFKYNPNVLIPFDPAFKMGRLDNGIRYIVRSNPIDKGKAYFYAFFKVGSIQEELDEYGAAHFVEHLYGDYPEYEDGIKNYMESIGLKFGPDINAATSEEETEYTIFNVPTQREATLDSVLMILKIMPFHSISPGEVEKQRKIVLAEWRLGSGTDLSKAWSHIHLSGTTNTLHEIIGDTTVINHITADCLKQFHDKWYRPDNLTIIAIGDFNAPKMEARIKQIFGSIPKAIGGKLQTGFQLTENKEPIIGITQADRRESSVTISYKHNTVPYTQKRLKEELMDRLISEMFSQRIKEAAENQAFPLTLNGANYGNSYLYLFQYNSYEINCQTSENIDKAISFVLTEKERIEKYGFTSQELIQVKKGMLQNYQIRQPGNNQLPYSEYYIKCLYYILNGRIYPSDDYLCRFIQSVVPSITLQEINNRFKEYTAGIQPMVNIEVARGRSLPTTEEIKTLLTTTRTVRPYVPSAPVTSLEDKTIHPGHIVKETHNKELGTTEWTLSNGMKVVIKPTGFNPNEIIFNGFVNKDSVLNLKGKYPYLDYYGEELYNEMGFDRYSNAKLNQFLKTRHLLVTKDFDNFNGYTTPQDFKTCLQLIHLKYQNQRWDESIYDKKIKEILNNKDALNVMSDTIFYLTHKYSENHIVSMLQLRQIHQKIFGNPAAFTFVFAGNIKSENVKPLIEQYLGSIQPALKQKKQFTDTIFSSAKEKQFQLPQEDIIREFNWPMNKEDALCQLCYVVPQMKFDHPYELIVRELIKSYMMNVLREKEHLIYGIPVWSLLTDTLNHAITFELTFNVGSQIARHTNEIARAAIRQLFKETLERKDFESQKAQLLKKRSRNLGLNEWWVRNVLYPYYQTGKNIIPDYLTGIKTMSWEGYTEFIHNAYGQGHIVNVLLLPKKDKR